MGEERLMALLQESLAAATRLGAAKPSTSVRDRRHHRAGEGDYLPHRRQADASGRERLVKLARKHGIALRQSYARVGKFALIKHQRYAHAKQFNRANRALKRLRTMLGAVIRDITRKLARRPELAQAFALPLRWPTRQGPAPARAGQEGLLPACSRGGMHRQRARPTSPMSSASRSPSPPHSIAAARPVRRPCQGAAAIL